MGVSDHLAALKDVALEGLRDAAHEIRTKPFKTAGKVVGTALYEAGDFITPGGLDPAADCIQGRKTFGEAAAWQAAGATVELSTVYIGKVAKKLGKGVGILAGITKKVMVRAGENAAQKPLQKGLSELAKKVSNSGRAGKQLRLKQLLHDDKLGKADRGWLKQEVNAIKRKSSKIGRDGELRPKKNIRVPPGKELAHRRGKAAKDGYGYEHSDLQDIDLHKLQHKHEGYK